MSEQTLPDPAGPPTVGESRAHVLDVLRATPEAVGVREIAERTGLHSNTARFHLDTLVKEGLAERGTEGGGRPGRPRAVYRAAASRVPAGRRSYQLLAQMLTGLITEALPQPAQAAVTAGEAWGRYLADTPSPAQRINPDEAVRRLTQVLTDVGFAPGSVQDGPDTVIPLRHCPFREVAEEHRDVVCSLHLGLMRGALKEVRAPLSVDRLEPFVEASLCLAHLTPAEQQADRTA
ncbi:helix-turn-helix transcriptional regulator [Streptomyces shenzhenensis]|uniref:helix-turn-helix transcriptional regulator n=1 Tax=Streptomyces shenzhenensis TaxID=943815 RepID=UPI0015EFE3CE|nr:helix-turn-helix domain-containing protein [Streptomyces shenzhenensis]